MSNTKTLKLILGKYLSLVSDGSIIIIKNVKWLFILKKYIHWNSSGFSFRSIKNPLSFETPIVDRYQNLSRLIDVKRISYTLTHFLLIL